MTNDPATIPGTTPPAEAVAPASAPVATTPPPSNGNAIPAQPNFSDVDSMKTRLNELHQKNLALEAEKERIVAELGPAKTLASKTPELEKSLREAQEAGKKNSELIISMKKESLNLKYGIPMNAMENKGLAELASFEEALKAYAGIKSGLPGNVAVGIGSGNAARPPMSSVERAGKILEDADRKHGIKRDTEGHLA